MEFLCLLYKKRFLPFFIVTIFSCTGFCQTTSNLQNSEKNFSFVFGLKIQSFNVSVRENPDFAYHISNFPDPNFYEGIPPGEKFSKFPYILGIQLADMKFGNWIINRSALGFDVVNYKYNTSLYGLNVGAGRGGKINKNIFYQGMVNWHISIDGFGKDMQYYDCYASSANDMVCYALSGEYQSTQIKSPSFLDFSLGLNFKLSSKPAYPLISIFGGYNIAMGEFEFGASVANPLLPSPPPGYVWIGPGSTITQNINKDLLRYNITIKNQIFIGIGLYYVFSIPNMKQPKVL